MGYLLLNKRVKKLLLILAFIIINLTVNGQSTCGTAVTLADGACLTGQSFPGTVNMAGLCVGGSNPALYIKFTAGTCSQFTITPSASIGSIGSQILSSTCTSIAGSLECHDNVVAGVPFVASTNDVNGNQLLTAGTQYVLRLWGAVGTATFKICFEANAAEDASNECGGALPLGTAATTFNNNGDCNFTGSATDATTTDPAAASLCAGSLENTQWIKFQPMAGVTSFQIVGSNINCTGGGCGFQFGIFSGSCGSLLSEGCYGNKVCSGGQSTQGPTNTNATDGFSIAWSGTSSTGFTATITKTGGGAFTGSEVFYLVMDGNADADCQYTLTGINVANLPIELISFTGDNYGDYNILKWLTASETNNNYFTLEKSVDAVNFVVAGIVDGAGNSSMSKSYSLIDKTPYGPLTYYRLRQTDFNGDSDVSELIAVSRPTNEKDFKVIRITNVLGQDVNEDSEGIKIYYFSNGTVLKKYGMKER